MIVTWSFLGIILIIGFIFLGIKMSESVKHGDIKIFFLALYTITLITFINIGISFYFYAKTAKKKGQKGLRGLQGKVGDKGDSGYCEDSCKVNSLKLFIIEKVREHVKNNNMVLTNIEQKVCRYFNFTEENEDKLQKIEDLTLKEYKTIKKNIEDNTVKYFSLFVTNLSDNLLEDGKLKTQNVKPYNLKLLKNKNNESIDLSYIDNPC